MRTRHGRRKDPRVPRHGTRTFLIFLGIVALITVGPAGGKSLSHAGDRSAMTSPSPSKASGLGVLLPDHRVIRGTVTEIKDGHAKVNTGDLIPRFLNLKKAEEKGISLQKGDRVEIAVNPQNLVVDFHRTDQRGWHRVVQGRLAQPLVVGQDYAVIRTKGQEQAFAVRPLAPSKVAMLPIHEEAVFLLDEANKIVDATFGSPEALEPATRRWSASPPRAPYRQVQGTIVKPMTMVTIQTRGGETKQYEVMPFVREKLANVSKDTPVTLLLDEGDNVMDVAVPRHADG